MNMQQFASLKAGDRIENLATNGSRATVTRQTEGGVHIQWDGSTQDFYFSVNSTAWMQWTYAPRDCTGGPCYREDCRRGDQCLGGDYAKIAGAA